MKKWLLERFLPMWAKETVQKENRRLKEEREELFQKLREKDAYIKGVHKTLRDCHGLLRKPRNDN